MKLVIEKGVSLENAIEQVSSFLKDNYSDYPIIKNDMSVYITLKNSAGQICPDNEKEYIIRDSGKATDVFEGEKQRAIIELHRNWKDYVGAYKNNLEFIQRKVEADEVYLRTAEEKGRTEINIAKRMKEYEKNKRSLDKDREEVELIVMLDEFIRDGRCRTHITKYTSRSAYKYTVSAFYVFVLCNGYTGYFDGRKLHKGEFNV
ncbi:MAG: hypothetical protein ACRC9L_03145 [Brevinema sp.]